MLRSGASWVRRPERQFERLTLALRHLDRHWEARRRLLVRRLLTNRCETQVRGRINAVARIIPPRDIDHRSVSEADPANNGRRRVRRSFGRRAALDDIQRSRRIGGAGFLALFKHLHDAAIQALTTQLV